MIGSDNCSESERFLLLETKKTHKNGEYLGTTIPTVVKFTNGQVKCQISAGAEIVYSSIGGHYFMILEGLARFLRGLRSSGKSTNYLG